MRHADRYGLAAVDPDVDTRAVWRRIRAIQGEIASTDDDPDRFRAMGVEIVQGTARLTGPHTVQVRGSDGEGDEDRELAARHILVCTGSRPAVRPVAGLSEAGFLTSETIFQLEQAPASITIIGGGPIGVEMAQGLNRLGVRVTLLQKGARLLPRDDPELVALLTQRLVEEGVELHLGVDITSVTVEDGTKVVQGHSTTGKEAGEPRRWSAEELLVATGRTANVDGLGLEAVGVRATPARIEVDARMRTTAPTIYAAGDVAGRFLFTHAAGYDAVRAVRDMKFPGRGTVTELIPWCTFTDPELAHVGLTVDEATKSDPNAVHVSRFDLAHSDRARADGVGAGAVVIVTARRGKIVGAHMLAPGAGEMIQEVALAISQELTLAQVARLVHVYPTLSTAVGQLAAEVAYANARKLCWLLRR